MGRNGNGWSKDDEQRLEQLVSEGLTASQIGRRFGCYTRNAIIGKVSRMGLALKNTFREGCFPKSRKRRVAGPGCRLSGPEAVAPVPPVSLPSAIVEQPTEARDASAPQPVPRLHSIRGTSAAVLALEPDDCRWPIGELGADFHFCCKTRFEQHSYCEEHVVRSTRRVW